VRRASARLFEAADAKGRAIVVVPQWNADEGSMVGACNVLNRFGLTALRMTLPYHEERRPQRMVRADAMVGPELGLTLQSVRRAVIEVRLAVAWLRQQGYRHIGLFGTSLGSCVGFLALAHEEMVQAAAFNHVAGHFADVVWEGLATRHVRESLDQHVDLDTLRRCWAPISPLHFAPRLAHHKPELLMISGAYDPIFLPAHSQSLVDALRQANINFRRIVLPCGHYTLGKLPFVALDAYLIVSFFRRHLR
jgi:dienelactone hydrolase